MLKPSHSSPLKVRHNSVSEKPFYMPPITKPSHRQILARGLEIKGSHYKNQSEISSSRLDSNRSYTWEDQQEELESSPNSNRTKPKISPTKESRLHPKQDGEFRNRLIKRSGSDLLRFKEVFIAPKLPTIKFITESEKTSYVEQSRSGSVSHRDYDRSREVGKDEASAKWSVSPLKKVAQKNVSFQNISQMSFDGSESPIKEIKEKEKSVIRLSPIKKEENEPQEIPLQEGTRVPRERMIFEFQVKTHVTTNGYQSPRSPRSPRGEDEVDKTSALYSPRVNLKDCKLKSRTSLGRKIDDLLKDVNLNFDIGNLHEEQRDHKKAIKAFEKYLHQVKSLGDKNGIIVALNRLGINYFHTKKYKKSLEAHLDSLEMNNIVDYFVAYYNIGLTLRKMQNFNEALVNLYKALDWAREFKDVESQCITFGQIGVTYFEMRDLKSAKESFQNCYNLTLKLKHVKLQLDCLINLSKICRATKTWDHVTKNELWELYNQAYSCAKKIDKNRTAEICLCNMGVLESMQKFSSYARTFNFQDSQGLYA